MDTIDDSAVSCNVEMPEQNCDPEMDELRAAIDEMNAEEAAAVENGESPAMPKSPPSKRKPQFGGHVASEAGLFQVWVNEATGAETFVPLVNAPLTIVEEITCGDDGDDATRRFHVRARIDGKTREAEVPGAEFSKPSAWVPSLLGGGVAVLRGDRDVVAGIVDVSRPLKQRREYRRAGWHGVDGDDVWLGANGCIGADGKRDTPQAVLAEPLARIEVGKPCNAGESAFWLSEVLSLAPLSIMAPLLLGVFRAALGDADLILWLVGVTGARKSAVSAVLQAFDGPAFSDARKLPGSWRQDTDKNLLAKVHKCKDCVIVIDEFTVIGNDDRELNEKAEMVGRSIANGAARGRARKDGDLAPTRPPGALLIGVGESIPGGAPSMRARMLVLRIDADDVDLHKLTGLQAAARDGNLAGVMAAFLAWLAVDLAARKRAFEQRVQKWRPHFAGTGHPRTADALAALAGTAAAMDAWLKEGGVPDVERAELTARFNTGLKAVGESQAMAAEAVDVRFLTLLRAAFASGHGHLANPRGCEPDVNGHAGWFRSQVEVKDGTNESVQPRGKCLGEVEGETVYLRLELALPAANAAAGASATRLTADPTTLGKALERGGHLSRKDVKRRTLYIRRKGESMWALKLASVFPPDDDADLVGIVNGLSAGVDKFYPIEA